MYKAIMVPIDLAQAENGKVTIEVAKKLSEEGTRIMLINVVQDTRATHSGLRGRDLRVVLSAEQALECPSLALNPRVDLSDCDRFTTNFRHSAGSLPMGIFSAFR